MSFPGDDHIYRDWPNRGDVGGSRAFHPFRPYSVPSDGRVLDGRRPDALTSFSRHSNDDEILRPNRQGGEGKGKENNDMEDPKGRARFGQYLVDTTGFQGPGKIREAPFTWLKVLWILGFLVACGFMIFQLVKLFEEFFSFPTKTVVELKFSPLPLPALTLCNVNPVRRSFAHNLSCPLQSLFKIPDDLRSQDCVGEDFTVLDLDAYDYYCDDCEYDYFYAGEDLDDFAERRENIALFLGSEDRETRRYVGHQLDDMVIECYLFGRPCSLRNVTGFLSRDYGNCYTLSMPNVKATKSGQEAALELTLNLEAEEFIEGYKTGYGLRVVLHENGTRPFPSSEGFTLSSGSETDIAVRMTQVKRQGGRYGKCDQGDVVAAISGYKYTIANCQDKCVHKKMVDDCGCIQLDDEEEEGEPLTAGSTAIRFCSTEAEYKCTYKAWDDYVNASVNKRSSTCNCHTPCQERIYTSTLSTRTWPILSHLPVLEEQVCKLNDQSPKCSYLGEDFTMENLDIRRSFTRVRLYYEQLNYEFVEEQPFYDTERFLSDIGGTLGLWIGVTALGLLELFELVFLALNTCRRRKSRA